MDWKGRTVVYTAVAGDYEHLGTHVFEDGVDYVYFSDCSRPIQSRWQVEDLSAFKHLHPRRAAKIPKVAPHEFAILEKYRYAIWIDGDMQIQSESFVEELLSYMRNGMVLTPHFDGRHCAYGEATIRPAKYASEPLDAQVAFYEQEGFPLEQGLYEGGVIGRDMRNAKVRELGFRWLAQNMIFSYQDQVSLPYCLWKMRFSPGVLPKSFRDFGWVHINAHKSEL
jgi:hypothetical protein